MDYTRLLILVGISGSVGSVGFMLSTLMAANYLAEHNCWQVSTSVCQEHEKYAHEMVMMSAVGSFGIVFVILLFTTNTLNPPKKRWKKFNLI